MRTPRVSETKRSRLALVLAALGLIHCSAMDEAMSARAPEGDCAGPGCGGWNGEPGGAQDDSDGDAEEDLEASFRAPVATGRHIWSANPESGRVAIIDASTLQISIAEAGFAPTHLAGIPSRREDEEQAIVINALSHDATLIRVESSGAMATVTVPIHADANAWQVSPTGRFAIAWTDAKKVDSPDPTEGFQDITVIDLAASPPSATRLAVGYRPRDIFIDKDERRAFVVTEPGISVISLDGTAPAAIDLVDVKAEGASGAAHVSITADGSFALVRQDGSARLRIIELASSAVVEIPLSGPVTDLDLSRDSAFATAVVRSPTAAPDAGSQIFFIPLPEAVADADSVRSVTIAGETVGSASLTDAFDLALLYTNATPSDRLTILSLDSGSYRTVPLKAPIKAVLPAPDSEHAVVILDPPAGSAKPGAFAVVPTLANLPARIQATEAPVLGVAISPAPSHRAMVVVRGQGSQEHAAYLARLPELQIDRIRLSSPPLATGIAPAAGMAFVAQEHPEGRLTFVGLESGTARTVTGFELGAKVVD